VIEVNLITLTNQNKIEKSEINKRITIDGQDNVYAVYKIPLKFLYYNDQNGRINTAYFQYVAENKKLDPEPGDSKYNKKFEELIYNSDPKSLDITKESIKKNKQQEPGVVLPDGRVIDGNRRFTALRKLQQESGITGYFEAAILELDVSNVIDEKKIKKLELDLQLGREERKSYDPIDRIFDVYNTVKIQRLLTVDEYKVASGAGNTKGINRDLRLADLIIEFLKITSPHKDPTEMFYLARELKLDGPIEEIESTINKLPNTDKKSTVNNLLTTLAVQIASSDSGDRDITRKMRDIKSNILKKPEIKAKFVDDTDDSVDVINDYFKDYPIYHAPDLKQGLESKKDVADAANELLHVTNKLSKKGENDSNRRKVLSNLEEIQSDLEEINSKDFKELTPSEFQKANQVLRAIKELSIKLSESGGQL